MPNNDALTTCDFDTSTLLSKVVTETNQQSALSQKDAKTKPTSLGFPVDTAQFPGHRKSAGHYIS